MRRKILIVCLVCIGLLIGSLTMCTSARAGDPVIVQQISWWYEFDGSDAPPDAFFVEEACVYWQAFLPRLPQNDPNAYYEIRGWYSNGRFASLQTYWRSWAFDHRFDYQINPDPGSINPYRDGASYPTRTFPPDDRIGSDTDLLGYTIRLIPVTSADKIPEVRPPNTLYMILTPYQDDEGTWYYLYQVVWRVYWDEMAENAYLPMLSRDPDDPYYVSAEFETEFGLDYFIQNPRAWEKRGQVLLPKIYLMTTSDNPPILDPPGEKFVGEPFRTGPATDMGTTPSTPEYAWWAVGSPNSAYANSATSYILADLDESDGDVFVVRFKAPTFPNTNAGDSIDPTVQQVRYWSLCTHFPETMTTYECRSDYELEIDEDGYVTAVFSPDDKKPANVGTNWMGYGSRYVPNPDNPDGEPILERMTGTRVYLRHMLPSYVENVFPESPYFYAYVDCADLYEPDTQAYQGCLMDEACNVSAHAKKYYPRTRFYAQNEYEACSGSCTIGVLDNDVFAAKFGRDVEPDSVADSDCDQDIDGVDLQKLSGYQEHYCAS